MFYKLCQNLHKYKNNNEISKSKIKIQINFTIQHFKNPDYYVILRFFTAEMSLVRKMNRCFTERKQLLLIFYDYHEAEYII